LLSAGSTCTRAKKAPNPRESAATASLRESLPGRDGTGAGGSADETVVAELEGGGVDDGGGLPPPQATIANETNVTNAVRDGDIF
jgi:hypothetical protein